MAGNYLGFSLRASEAPPAILGPSEAARRLPGPKNPIFLKLAVLISGLLLGGPWGSWNVPEALLGSPEPPSLLQAPPGLRKAIETYREQTRQFRRHTTHLLETLRPAKKS